MPKVIANNELWLRNSVLDISRILRTVPHVAPANTCRLYYDAATNRLLCSANGGPYGPLESGSSTDINVQARGVPADGVTDAAAPLADLMAEVVDQVGIEGKATLFFPAGTYELAITTPILVPPQIGFRCEDGAIFRKTTNALAGCLFAFTGTVTDTESLLTSDGTTGSQSVAVAEGALFAAGDRVLIADSTFHMAAGFGRNEEINEVLSVSGNTLTLHTPLINDYATADTAKATVIHPVTLGMVGGEVIVPQGGNGGGVSCELGYGNTFERVTVRGAKASPSFFIYRSRGTTLTNCAAFDGQNKSASGNGYGFDVAESSYDITITGFTGRNLRECLVTTYSRRVKIEAGTFEGFYDNGVNTHNAAVSDVTIRGNFFANGDPTGLGSAIIVGQGTSSNEVDRNVLIEGNTITGMMVNGILVQAPAAPVVKTSDSVTIIGNTVEDCGRDNNNHSAITVSRFSTAVITGNRIDGRSNDAQRYGIQLVTVTDATVTDNQISNLTQASAVGIRWDSCDNVRIAGNQIKAVTTNATQGALSTNIRLIDNKADTTTQSQGNVWGSGNQYGASISPFRWNLDSFGEGMRLTEEGLLGLGQTSPVYRLDIRSLADNDLTSGSLRVRNANNGTGSGSLVTLESASASGFLGCFPSGYTNNSAFADNLVLALNSDASSLIFSANAASQFFAWRVGALNEQLRLDASANLLLGTTSAIGRMGIVGRADQIQLRVRGHSTQTTAPVLFQVENSAASLLFAVENDGKIRTNQTSAASSVGTVVGKFPVYNGAGTLVGYAPLYDSLGT